jgi:hypothetical protein
MTTDTTLNNTACGDPAPAFDFAAWLAREMPAGTVIADPAWWAPRILRAVLRSSPRVSEQADERGHNHAKVLAMSDGPYFIGPAFDPVREYKPGSWFDARTLDEMQAFYVSRLPAIREAAKEHGYAIGMHGSLRRDFDLMAMQWRDDASDKDTLAHAIAVAACGITRDGPFQWEQKPNGRFAVSMPICWTDHGNPEFGDKPSLGHIDLSVITQQAAPAAPALRPLDDPKMAAYLSNEPWISAYIETLECELRKAPQAHVLPPTRGTDSQHDASASVLTKDRIGELYRSVLHIGHATNRELAFAHAIEAEVLAQLRLAGAAKGGNTNTDSAKNLASQAATTAADPFAKAEAQPADLKRGLVAAYFPQAARVSEGDELLSIMQTYGIVDAANRKRFLQAACASIYKGGGWKLVRASETTTAGTDALRNIRDVAYFDSTANGAMYYSKAENALAAIEARDAQPKPEQATTASASGIPLPEGWAKAGERIVLHNFPGMITNCIAAATVDKRKEFIAALLAGIEYEIEAARRAPGPSHEATTVSASERKKFDAAIARADRPGAAILADALRRAPSPSREAAPLDDYAPGQWWLAKLAALWGHHAEVDLDTRRAAKVACDFAALVFAQQGAQTDPFEAVYCIIRGCEPHGLASCDDFKAWKSALAAQLAAIDREIASASRNEVLTEAAQAILDDTIEIEGQTYLRINSHHFAARLLGLRTPPTTPPESQA